MQDNVGFQSQQFGEQVAQRRDRYAQQNIDTAKMGMQIPAMMQETMARQQAMRINDQQAASQLAYDELKRQDAMQQLQWARELHTTDMLAMQKEDFQLNLQMKRQQVEKLARDAGMEGYDTWSRMDDYDRDAALANGVKLNLSGGRIVAEEASPEDVAAAKARREGRIRRGTSGERTLRQMRLDLTSVMSAISKAEDDGRSEDVASLTALKDDLMQEIGAVTGIDMQGARQSAPKPVAPARPPAAFVKKVDDLSSMYGNKISTIGPGNNRKVIEMVLRDVDTYRRAMQSQAPNLNPSDDEVVRFVLDKLEREQTQPESGGYNLLRHWAQMGALDKAEAEAMQGEIRRAVGEMGRNR